MYNKLNEIHKNLIPMKLTTTPYNTIQYNKKQTISYNAIQHKHTFASLRSSE